MKIFRLEIENFRLLKNFSMDMEDDLSLVIGKNNTGKTSILSVLEKFLNHSEKNRFTIDDFNLDFKKKLKLLLENIPIIEEKDYEPIGIKLRLFISYNDRDNLANVSRVMMNLDPENNVIVLEFEYALDYSNYRKIKEALQHFLVKESTKEARNQMYKSKGVVDFLSSSHADFFTFTKKSLAYDHLTDLVDSKTYIDLVKEEISTKEIINFKFISAKRDVANKELDKTLSSQTSRIYRRTEASDEQNIAIEDFKDKLSDTDSSLSDIYQTLFKDIIDKVRQFGGVKIDESQIEVISTLQHRELLEGNTTVVYNHDQENKLPEHYNGLGYMNLISMIFEIEILLHEFRGKKDTIPADVNLLFIEEPEAHTHPQMQYIFIKNIKNLLKEGVLRKDGIQRELQYIISTHSASIVADSDFDDIKYLKKEETNGVIAKNLKDLKKEYEVDGAQYAKQYQFLTQYLTIDRAEIFFADKAVLIEGDTERILVPTMMRKLDIEEAKKHEKAKTIDDNLPLLSQNISIIEVGAYSQIFEKFIDFLGIKTLIITDLDAVDGDKGKCEVAKGVDYSNSALKYFFNEPSLAMLQGFSLKDKTFRKENEKWKNQIDGELCIVYQTNDGGYTARSFEDGFIHVNRNFITPNKEEFQGLQSISKFDDLKIEAYHLAEKCIKKKTHFALDILYHSDKEFSNWNIPMYIKEGLLWLKQD